MCKHGWSPGPRRAGRAAVCQRTNARPRTRMCTNGSVRRTEVHGYSSGRSPPLPAGGDSMIATKTETLHAGVDALTPTTTTDSSETLRRLQLATDAALAHISL